MESHKGFANTKAFANTPGFHFLFPVGASIPADGYLIVANKMAFFMQAYGTFLPANVQVYGDPSGGLQDNGEYIELVDNTKAVVFSMRFQFVTT